MANVLIRNVPDEVVAAIDSYAERLGLSRAELLRRFLDEQAQRGRASGRTHTVHDLKAASARLQGVLDEQLMRDAWS